MEVNANILKALGKMTYGLYVLTAKKGEEINGMIASWVSQVSFNPVQVMVGVRKNRYTHSIIKESGIFALNVLAKESAELVRKFKSPTPEEKFNGIGWKTGATGAPILGDTLAYMDCRLVNTTDTGDHTLFIGEVVDGGALNEGIPMTSLDFGKVYLGEH